MGYALRAVVPKALKVYEVVEPLTGFLVEDVGVFFLVIPFVHDVRRDSADQSAEGGGRKAGVAVVTGVKLPGDALGRVGGKGGIDEIGVRAGMGLDYA